LPESLGSSSSSSSSPSRIGTTGSKAIKESYSSNEEALPRSMKANSAKYLSEQTVAQLDRVRVAPIETCTVFLILS
jgi:hypothetical protein